MSDKVAWSCSDCGHIVSDLESTSRPCAQCGTEPHHWLAAPISDKPADAGLPSVAEGTREEVVDNESAGVITSPAGTDGNETNPELRVRY